MKTSRLTKFKSSFRLSSLGPLVLLLLGCFFAYQAITAGGAKEQTLNAPTTLAARTKQISPSSKKIQNVRVGERAAPVKNPTGEFDDALGRTVDPATWRKLDLRAEKRDGTFCDIELLRPKWWIDERAAQVGGSVYISVPECGIEGNAEVLSIDPCPTIQPGTGPIVIGTFAHQSAEVINVYVEGLNDPIGVTVNHPFWSDTRQEFVAAGNLQPSERLHGIKGTPRITSITPRGPPEPVYNVEVLGEHVYEVSTAGLLVHNTCGIVTELSLPGGGKVDLSNPKGLLNDATKNLVEANIRGTGKTVLGPFRPEDVNYINKANVKNANYFDIGNAWNSLTDAERWAANQHFLDRIAEAGDQVLLSIPKGKIRPDSYLAKEIEYLTKHRGYKWVNQWSLVPGN